jgi:acid stress-induced BolA-like protein IbaG/YrbA
MDCERARGPVSLRLMRFAERVRDELDAIHVLLYGPRTRGDPRWDANFDLIIVAERLRDRSQSERLARVYTIFEASVGRSPLKATCLTPEEFEYARSHLTLVQAVLPQAIDLLSDAAPAELARIEPARPPTLTSIAPAVRRFAERLRHEFGAERVLLFGSRARGTAMRDSDFDLIIVSNAFRSIPRLERGRDVRALFAELGGHAPLDLICLTPAEFAEARTQITLVNAVLPEALELLPPDELPAS